MGAAGALGAEAPEGLTGAADAALVLALFAKDFRAELPEVVAALKDGPAIAAGGIAGQGQGQFLADVHGQRGAVAVVTQDEVAARLGAATAGQEQTAAEQKTVGHGNLRV